MTLQIIYIDRYLELSVFSIRWREYYIYSEVKALNLHEILQQNFYK